LQTHSPEELTKWQRRKGHSFCVCEEKHIQLESQSHLNIVTKLPLSAENGISTDPLALDVDINESWLESLLENQGVSGLLESQHQFHCQSLQPGKNLQLAHKHLSFSRLKQAARTVML